MRTRDWRGVEDDPVGYLTDLDRSGAKGRIAFLLLEDRHTVSRGHLDQNVRTGELRDAYLFDSSLKCDECRPYREAKETARFVRAFEVEEMWVTVLSEETVRSHVQGWCKRRGTRYAVVPIWTRQLVVVTTGMIDDTSALVEDHNDVFPLVMRHWWPGKKLDNGKRAGISRSKGAFFPPEREYDFFEVYHKETGIRCWHLHPTEDTALVCRDKMPHFYPELWKGWYLRGTTEWHRVGRLAVTGWALEALVDECGIGHKKYAAPDVASLLLEPMSWEDPRLQRLLVEAGWKPPRDNFQVPPITLELRVAVHHGRITGRSVGGTQ
jgi:hypothetical protein